MSKRVELENLVALRSEEGSWRALARAITLVENAPPSEVDIPPPSRLVHSIGFTGPPGSGKSTLVGQLIEAYANSGRRVGVVAIDPSSPTSGGALLGDRLRMERQLQREGVFVRSLASRGSLGGLAASARNVVRLLEASAAFDVVIVETVGAGQTEIAIANLADTVVLVTVPGLGDAVQVIKAGLCEVADLVVVNMADRPGAAETMRHFRLSLGREVPVLKTIATDGTGVAGLLGALDECWTALSEGDGLSERRRKKELADAALIAMEWVRVCAANGRSGSAKSVRQAVGAILKEAAKRWHE